MKVESLAVPFGELLLRSKHYMKKKEIIEVLEHEIKWCETHPENMPEDWRKGFINGLKQAKRLVKAIITVD